MCVGTAFAPKLDRSAVPPPSKAVRGPDVVGRSLYIRREVELEGCALGAWDVITSSVTGFQETKSPNAGTVRERWCRSVASFQEPVEFLTKVSEMGIEADRNNSGISSSSIAMDTELKRATGWRSRQHWQSKPIGSTWSQSVLLWDWAVRNDDPHERRTVREFLQRAHVGGRVARGPNFVLRLVPWMGFG